ncbi:MAG: hypothetical protein NVS1B7_7030 [Candidatus Saccharimonadales bacterium]
MNRNLLSRWVSHQFVLQLIAIGVFANGFIILSTALAGQLLLKNVTRINIFAVNIPVLIGLSLIYLATLLVRRKRAAWMVVVPLYGFICGANITKVTVLALHHHLSFLTVMRSIILPVTVVVALWYYRSEFVVKSDIRSFTYSLRTIALILSITLLYGVVGFQILDNRDFHQELSITSSIHHTVDQFDFTTDTQIVPYTKRARLFIDSLSTISIGSLLFIGLSLFRPIKARFSDETHNRERATALLTEYTASSEDFFKLWPHDKNYYFTPKGTAALAYHVQAGVALSVGDPIGQPKSFDALMRHYLELCRVNDWLPAFIHTEPKRAELYKRYDFSLQKIGEEAIVDLDHFMSSVVTNKYFRQINNKFEKQGYTTELLLPPHNIAVLARLKEISKNWLELPGRSERGFMMGYYSDEYMQMCPVMVVRDAASTIQAFINQVQTYDPVEANYDLLRHNAGSLGNINDFLVMNYISYLHDQGFARLNLGLCPLAGLTSRDQDKTVVDSALQFVYANGDRFYSFSGLRRFKAKYEPEWSSRYIAYRGGIRGFTRTLNALNKAMGKTKPLKLS